MPGYRLSNAAAADLDGILDYTAENFGDAQAKRYAEQLHRCMGFAAESPRLGRPYKSAKTGKAYERYSCGRHMIFFEPDGDGILVVRILHDAMDFPRHV